MTAKPGFVSVVAAVHDGATYVASFVEECVAVLARHYRDHELILVDDGSRDETVARLEPLLRLYPSLRVVRLTRRFEHEWYGSDNSNPDALSECRGVARQILGAVRRSEPAE